MVKKIDSSKGAGKTGAASEVNRAISTSEVGAVQQVKGASRAGGAARIKRATRPMSATEISELMRMVSEEADRMLSPDLPANKKETIEQAVQMAISGGILEEE